MNAWLLLAGLAAAAGGWPPKITVDRRFELWAEVKTNPPGYDDVAAQKVLLKLGEPPALLPRQPLSPDERAWVDTLRHRARRRLFLPDGSEHVKAVRAELRDRDYRSMLEEYTGLRFDAELEMILCPWRERNEGNMNHIECVDGGRHKITMTFGPTEPGSFQSWNRRWDVWHELGHTELDAELEKHAEALRGTGHLYKEGCYGSWSNCVREHLVQGLAFRVLRWADRTGRTREPVWTHEFKTHMPYLGLVIAKLDEYEADRAAYPTLKHFYARWLSAFPKKGDEPVALEPAKTDCRPRPAVPAVPTPKDALKKSGTDAYARKDLAAAERDLRKALELEPGDPETHLSLAVVLSEAGRRKEALEHAERAVALAPAGGSLGEAARRTRDRLKTRP